MYDELTAVDIAKINEELDYRKNVLRPKQIEDVQTARAFGDLSENFEYKAAKQEKSRNDSRIRYLERMLKTAKVITAETKTGEIGLFDTVELLFEDDGETQTVRLVTALRQDALRGLISPVSPLGKALLGKKTGDRARVQVSETVSYTVVVRSIEKGTDDETLPIRGY